MPPKRKAAADNEPNKRICGGTVFEFCMNPIFRVEKDTIKSHFLSLPCEITRASSEEIVLKITKCDMRSVRLDAIEQARKSHTHKIQVESKKATKASEELKTLHQLIPSKGADFATTRFKEVANQLVESTRRRDDLKAMSAIPVQWTETREEHVLRLAAGQLTASPLHKKLLVWCPDRKLESRTVDVKQTLSHVFRNMVLVAPHGPDRDQDSVDGWVFDGMKRTWDKTEIHFRTQMCCALDGKVCMIASAPPQATMWDDQKRKCTAISNPNHDHKRETTRMVAFQNKIFVLDANGPSEVFDPSANQWTNFAFEEGQRLDDFQVVVFSSHLFVVGTEVIDESKRANVMLRFDGRVWEPVGFSGVHEFGTKFALVVFENSLLLIGGTSDCKPCVTVDRFDPILSKWFDFAPLVCNRTGAHAAVVDGTVHVFGGNDEHPAERLSGAGWVHCDIELPHKGPDCMLMVR